MAKITHPKTKNPNSSHPVRRHPVRRHPVQYIKITATRYPIYKQITGNDCDLCTVVAVRYNHLNSSYDLIEYSESSFSVSNEVKSGHAVLISEELFNHHLEQAFCTIKDAVTMVQ
jgi:hypothetical protein